MRERNQKAHQSIDSIPRFSDQHEIYSKWLLALSQHLELSGGDKKAGISLNSYDEQAMDRVCDHVLRIPATGK